MVSNLFDIEEIKSQYNFKGEYYDFDILNNGHINNTYVLNFDYKGCEKSYVLQQINTAVFKNPEELMRNYVGVTDFVRNKVIEAGGNPLRESVKVYYTKDGKPYYLDKSGRYWRVINYVINTVSYNFPDNTEICRKAGKTFGNFQKLLADYPAEELCETIPNFHNTVSRYNDFIKAVEEDKAGRVAEVTKEIEFVKARKKDCSVLLDLLEKGELPLRVTHNDTKLNNVLFDKKTGEGICVIDLDTVMPGLSLYDFGDSLRFAGNTADEDEKDLSKVRFNAEIYRSYTEGYLSAAGDSLTPAEIYYLPFSVKLMTLECGIRFLTDYLNGDVYFRISRPEHNLDRCRTQFKLVEEIEEKYMELMGITQLICEHLK
ncbi:MAG: aminoglycoside phosphotransferase family protein [Clostridia bacterium]|nr:aminoglycoside phosphotransferase family protein [Clostridia bacterium]